MGLPEAQGLYDPRNEHDACGVGFVANIKGAKSHAIIAQGLEILVNIDHRGAVGADPLVGDGAGILIQIPDALFRDWAKDAKVDLPPRGETTRNVAIDKFEHFIEVEGQVLLGWRDVPYDLTGLGQTVKNEKPVI